MSEPVIRNKETFAKAIEEIPGTDGWWHSDGGETYVGLGERLVERGFTYDEAVDLLAAAYGAAAGEFGA